MIPFNRAFLCGKELEYIADALATQTSGNGKFTKKCHEFFASKYGFKNALLTTSCTDALEMAALLLDIHPGDEVIVPSFTFVSTPNAFVLRGARIVFADSMEDHPNIDVNSLEQLITPKTKAIVVVHYGGVAVDMDDVMSIAKKYNLFIVEDAAQSIDAFYKGRPLGAIGHLGCFSFHETKNIISGEGGLLVINDERFVKRAEILWEKGTNRSSFIRGEVDKYGWVDVGSSFLPSEITAGLLYAQLEHLEIIQLKRLEVWNYYMEKLLPHVSQYMFQVPNIPFFANHNGHIFYLLCRDNEQRDYLIKELKKAGIDAFFHYLPLHLSKYYLERNNPVLMPNTVKFSERIIRLPVYSSLTKKDQDNVIQEIKTVLSSYKFSGRGQQSVDGRK